MPDMHKVMVGAQIDIQGEPHFFGWDEVNDYLLHGMKVVALEPGEVFMESETTNTEGDQPTTWYFTVILDDYGIDPA
jgi:hypothetical protein